MLNTAVASALWLWAYVVMFNLLSSVNKTPLRVNKSRSFTQFLWLLELCPLSSRAAICSAAAAFLSSAPKLQKYIFCASFTFTIMQVLHTYKQMEERVHWSTGKKSPLEKVPFFSFFLLSKGTRSVIFNLTAPKINKRSPMIWNS